MIISGIILASSCLILDNDSQDCKTLIMLISFILLIIHLNRSGLASSSAFLYR